MDLISLADAISVGYLPRQAQAHMHTLPQMFQSTLYPESFDLSCQNRDLWAIYHK